MQKFKTGLPAKQAHRNLLTALQTLENAQQNAILWFGEIKDRQLYRELGYTDIHQYARQELGWAKTKIYDYLKMTQKLQKLPRVKKKVEEGKLGYAKTRQIVSVASPETEDEWLYTALRSPKRALEQKVKKAKRRAAEAKTGQPQLLPEKPVPKASPDQRITLVMTPVQLARYEALWEKLRKLGGLPADRVEALLAVLAGQVETSSRPVENSNRLEKPTTNPPLRPPVQVQVQVCPECAAATLPTSRGDLILSKSQLEQMHCDATISKPGQRNTATIPPRTRREVLSRDHHRCTTSGCGNSMFLEVHHRVPRAQGGSNHPDNLVTLCSSCHAQAHHCSGQVREAASAYTTLSGTLADTLAGILADPLVATPGEPALLFRKLTIIHHIPPGLDHERSQQHRGNSELRHRNGTEGRRPVHRDRRAGAQRA